jgi:hypothetical protein
MKSILTIAAVALLGVLAYQFVPGVERSVNAGVQDLQENEKLNNWEYYYDQEIGKLESKLAEFEQQRVETVTQALRLERDIEKLNSEVTKAESLVQESSAAIRAAKLGVSPESLASVRVILLDQEKSLDQATEQLRVWIGERNRIQAEAAQLQDTLSRAQEARTKELAVFEKARAQIDALKREKNFMRSQMKISEIEQRMLDLEKMGDMWASSDSPSELASVRGLIDDKLLHDQARKELARQENQIDQQMGLQEAFEQRESLGSSAQVEAELAELLGG